LRAVVRQLAIPPALAVTERPSALIVRMVPSGRGI
jgi:hypothetical protein